MTVYRLTASFFLLIALALVMGFGDAAYAAGLPQVKCGDYPGLTNKIASCIRASVDGGVNYYFDAFYPKLRVTIGAVMTLAVVIYGVMIAHGMVEKVGRDTLILLFKIAAVAYFCANSGFIYRSAITSMDSMAKAVISYAPTHGKADVAGSDFAKSVCLKNMANQNSNPWLGMDCLVDTVVGIKLPDDKDIAGATDSKGKTYYNNLTNGKNEGMSRGLLYLFFSNMQTSVVGFVFAVIGFVFLWGLIALIIKTLFIYLAGYMGVAFMSIISPIFIPMILFQHTRQYFDKWVKSFFSFALQPIIMMAFVTFSIVAVDFAAFSGKYSVFYRIAGEASRDPNGFSLNEYLTKPRLANGTIDAAAKPADTSVPIIGKEVKYVLGQKTDNPETPKVVSQDAGGVVKGLKYVDCSEAAIKADNTGLLKTTCGIVINMGPEIHKINWVMMAKARSDPPVTTTETGPDNDALLGQAMLKEVLSSLAFCALVVFLMNGFLKLVPLIAYDITGDFMQSSNLSGAVAGRWKDGQAFSEIGSRIQRALK